MFTYEEIHDYTGRSGAYYPYRKTILTSTYNYKSWTESTDGDLILVKDMPGESIKWLYDTTPPRDGLEVVHTSNVADSYISASGINVNSLRVLGDASATDVTCNSLYVGGSVNYSDVLTFYFDDTAVWAVDSSHVYSDITYTSGKATACTVNGNMQVSDGTASGCTVNGDLTVSGTNAGSSYLHSEDPSVEIVYHSGTVSACTVKNDLEVEYGGKAYSIIVSGGDAHIGTAFAMSSYPADMSYDEAREQQYREFKEECNKYGDSVADDITVTDGNVYVIYGGQLSNATIDGCLVTKEGSKLGGVITCKSLNLEELSESTAAITIKVDLNDYALPVETRVSTQNGYSVRTDYYADLHKTITVRSADGATTVANSTFSPEKEGLDPSNWRNAFSVDLGSIGDYALKGGLSDITIDCLDTLTNFDEGTITLNGKLLKGSTPPIRFNAKEDKFALKVNASGDEFYGFQYNSALFGEGYEVLWLENGTDDAVEYTIDLPDDCMKGASENISIKARDLNGQIRDVELMPAGNLRNNTLKVTATESNDLVLKGEEKDGREHQCDLELWVVPEVIQGLDKNATGKFAELLRQSQGNICNLTATWPNIHTSLIGVAFDLTNMGVTFTVTADRTASLKMQGKLEWAISEQRGGTGKNTKLVFDLSGDNYIAIRMPWKKNAVLDVVGSMTCPDFTIGKFGFSNVSLSLDTTSDSWSVSAFVTLPGVKYAFGGEIGVVEGCWDSMTIGVDNLNVPLGATGLMLQKVTGTVKDMATSLDMTFGGTLGLTYGPTISIDGLPQWLGIDDGDYSLCELVMSAEISTNGTISGTASLVSLGNIVSGSGTVAANAGDFLLSGQFGMLNNCISINGEFTSGSGGVTISGSGQMQLPNERIFGLLAGTGVTVSAYANFGDRYVMAWHEGELFGNKIAYGMRCTFDGDVDLLGTTSISAFGAGGTRGANTSEMFELSGEGVVLFQCAITDGHLETELMDESGNTYTQANIIAGAYDNIKIVNELSSNTCITIAVNQQKAGVWTMTAYDNDSAEFSCYALADNPLAPTVTSVSMGADGRSAKISYSLGNIDALENVSLSIFCLIPGIEDAARLCIAQLALTAGTGAFVWELEDDFLGGEYAFQLMAEADGLAPAESTATAPYSFAVLDTEAPDAIMLPVAQWSDTGTAIRWDVPYDNVGIAGYKFRYGTDADNLHETQLTGPQFILDNLPNGNYHYQVAAFDAAGNCSAWSQLDEAHVNTRQNATYRNIKLDGHLDLAEYEGAVGIDASSAFVTTAVNSLLADAILDNAKISGMAENLTVNGMASLMEGGFLYEATVNGELQLENYSKANNITVNNDAMLAVGNRSTVDGVLAKAGSLVVLKQGADYKNLTLEAGASLAFAGDEDNNTNKFLMTDDIFAAGNVSLARNLYGNGHKLYLDVSSGYVNDMSKIVGDTLVVIADCSQKGSYKIAQNIGMFDRALTVRAKDGSAAAVVGFDAYEMIGDSACILSRNGDSLFLNVRDASLEAPVISVSDNDLDTKDEILVTLNSYAENSNEYKWRFSMREDMSNAIVSDSEALNWTCRFTIGKEAFAEGTDYYLQVCTQDDNGFWSEWSDAVSFTVTPKYVPLAPIVSGASLKSTSYVTLKANPAERGTSCTFRYADNPEMANPVSLYDYGTNTGSISKEKLEKGRTYYAQVSVPAYGWGKVISFTIEDNADYENYTVTSADDYFTLTDEQLGVNMTVADDPKAWFAIRGTVNGLNTQGGFTRLDAGCHVADMTVNGGKVWLNEGEVSNLIVEEGNTVRLMNTVINGARIAGTLDADYNVTTPALNGVIVIQGNILLDIGYLASHADFVFDVSAHNDKKEQTFLSNIRVLTGSNSYSLRLDDDVEIGDYVLFFNEYADEVAFTLLGTDDAAIGTLTSGQTPVCLNGTYYSIVNANSRTYLHVSDDASHVFIGDIQYYKDGAICGAVASVCENISVSAHDDIDYVLVGGGGQIRNAFIGAGGTAKIGRNSLASYMSVGSGGKMIFADDAAILNIDVLQGGEVVCGNIILDSGGDVNIGGRLTLNGALSTNTSNKTIRFNLDELTSPLPDAMISDYSKINFTANYQVHVSSQQVNGVYTLLDNAYGFDSFINLIVDDDGNAVPVRVGASSKRSNTTYALDKNDGKLQLTVSGGKNGSSSIKENSVVSSENGVAWETTRESVKVLQFSYDNFKTVLEKTLVDDEISTLNLAGENCKWRVRCEDELQWVQGNDICGVQNKRPELVAATDDGVEDIFFASPSKKWVSGFCVKHMGYVGDWEGTREQVALKGKNRIEDVFQGAADTNTLYLTDDENGDALTLEDIYSAIPEILHEQQARIANIREIQAGAGDDIIDLTSQLFEYTGSGVEMHGGDGNDVLWASSGRNLLFGDDGDDSLVGGSGNDVLVGGKGNDSMHGGGGMDIFCFCDDWGTDTVVQLADGSVTLWFNSGNESNWNSETLTYADKGNSVSVSGVAPEMITLKFGDDGTFQYANLMAKGAFDASSSTSIFIRK